VLALLAAVRRATILEPDAGRMVETLFFFHLRGLVFLAQTAQQRELLLRTTLPYNPAPIHLIYATALLRFWKNVAGSI